MKTYFAYTKFLFSHDATRMSRHIATNPKIPIDELLKADAFFKFDIYLTFRIFQNLQYFIVQNCLSITNPACGIKALGMKFSKHAKSKDNIYMNDCQWVQFYFKFFFPVIVGCASPHFLFVCLC